MDFALPRPLFRPLLPWACLVIALACKTQGKNEQVTTSLVEQCNANAAYAWSEGKCQKRSLLAIQEQENACGNQGDDYTWVNKKCIKKTDVDSPRERCAARGDGSYWQVDPATRDGSCVGANTAVNKKEECSANAAKGFIWQDGQCLSIAAQDCLRGGDYWLAEFGCMNPEQKACFDRQDGSKWGGDRCLSGEELSCQEQGYHFQWMSSPEGGYCSAKQFVDYCLDGVSAPKDIQHTVSEILVELGYGAIGDQAADCKAGALDLEAKLALDLDKRLVSNLSPLTGLRNLVRLNVQENAVTDLSPLESLLKLEELDLTSNKVQGLKSLAGLTRLKVLYLSYNEIADPTALANLPNLERLYLSHNQITSLAGMIPGDTEGGLRQLQQIELQDNCSLKDATPLIKLPKLKYVTLRNTGVKTAPAFNSAIHVDLAPCP